MGQDHKPLDVEADQLERAFPSPSIFEREDEMYDLIHTGEPITIETLRARVAAAARAYQSATASIDATTSRDYVPVSGQVTASMVAELADAARAYLDAHNALAAAEQAR